VCGAPEEVADDGDVEIVSGSNVGQRQVVVEANDRHDDVVDVRLVCGNEHHRNTLFFQLFHLFTASVRDEAKVRCRCVR